MYENYTRIRELLQPDNMCTVFWNPINNKAKYVLIGYKKLVRNIGKSLLSTLQQMIYICYITIV